MKVEFRESFFYEAWIVVSNFGTQNSYRIYIKVLDPGRPEIAGKQTRFPGGSLFGAVRFIKLRDNIFR